MVSWKSLLFPYALAHLLIFPHDSYEFLTVDTLLCRIAAVINCLSYSRTWYALKCIVKLWLVKDFICSSLVSISASTEWSKETDPKLLMDYAEPNSRNRMEGGICLRASTKDQSGELSILMCHLVLSFTGKALFIPYTLIVMVLSYAIQALYVQIYLLSMVCGFTNPWIISTTCSYTSFMYIFIGENVLLSIPSLFMCYGSYIWN